MLNQVFYGDFLTLQRHKILSWLNLAQSKKFLIQVFIFHNITRAFFALGMENI
jgi:hypothetical protein